MGRVSASSEQPAPNAAPEMLQVEDILSAAVRGWWLLALFALLGGLAGLGINLLQPVVYESGFTILSTIDLGNTGEMSQFEEDLGMEAIGQVISHPLLYQRVTAAAAKQGLPVGTVDLSRQASFERRMGTWRARLRGSDPRALEQVAAVWREMALADLLDAHEHALTVDGLLRKQQSLEACLNQLPFTEPSAGLCGPLSLRALQAQLRASARVIAEERAASRGLISAVIIDASPQPVVPAAPVLYRRGQMALAGLLIGLLLGVWGLRLVPRGKRG